MNGVDDLRRRLERVKGRASHIDNHIKVLRRQIREKERDEKASEEALVIIQAVAQKTQQQLEFHLSDIVSTSMEAIFPEPYGLVVEFNVSRGRVETQMFFEREGNKVLPLDASGGGAVDVAALALRFSCYAIQNPRRRPLMILDEPLKWLKGADLPEKGAQMIREISKRMGIQIIMNSHDPDLIEAADRVIEVKLVKGKSIVTYTDV